MYAFDVNKRIVPVRLEDQPLILSENLMALSRYENSQLIWVKSIQIVTRIIIGVEIIRNPVVDLFSIVKNRSKNERTHDKLVLHNKETGKLIFLRDIVSWNKHEALLVNGKTIDSRKYKLYIKGDKYIDEFWNA